MPLDPTPNLGLNRFGPGEGGAAGLLNENADLIDSAIAGLIADAQSADLSVADYLIRQDAGGHWIARNTSSRTDDFSSPTGAGTVINQALASLAAAGKTTAFIQLPAISTAAFDQTIDTPVDGSGNTVFSKVRIRGAGKGKTIVKPTFGSVAAPSAQPLIRARHINDLVIDDLTVDGNFQVMSGVEVAPGRVAGSFGWPKIRLEIEVKGIACAPDDSRRGVALLLGDFTDPVTGLPPDPTATPAVNDPHERIEAEIVLHGCNLHPQFLEPTAGVVADPALDTITWNGHGLSNGQKVHFGGTATPGGLAYATNYFVINATTNTFKVAATSGGSAIDITSAGTAVTCTRTSHRTVALWALKSYVIIDKTTQLHQYGEAGFLCENAPFVGEPHFSSSEIPTSPNDPLPGDTKVQAPYPVDFWLTKAPLGPFVFGPLTIWDGLQQGPHAFLAPYPGWGVSVHLDGFFISNAPVDASARLFADNTYPVVRLDRTAAGSVFRDVTVSARGGWAGVGKVPPVNWSYIVEQVGSTASVLSLGVVDVDLRGVTAPWNVAPTYSRDVAYSTFSQVNPYPETWSLAPEITAAEQDMGGAIAFTGVISPAQITADQNDYSPAGLAGASMLRLSTDASRSLNGLDASAAVNGRIYTILNVGAQPLVLVHGAGTSLAANRFYLVGGVGLALQPNEACIIQYDAPTGRWKALGRGAVAVAGPDADIVVDGTGAAGTAGLFARSLHGHRLVSSGLNTWGDGRYRKLAAPPVTLAHLDAEVDTTNTSDTQALAVALAAAFFAVGTRIKLCLEGNLDNGSGGNVTLSVKVKYNGVQIASAAVGGIATGVTNRPWVAEFFITCQSTGGAGAFVGGGHTLVNAVDQAASGTASIDTTGAHTLEIDVNLSAFGAGVTLARVRSGVILQEN